MSNHADLSSEHQRRHRCPDKDFKEPSEEITLFTIQLCLNLISGGDAANRQHAAARVDARVAQVDTDATFDVGEAFVTLDDDENFERRLARNFWSWIHPNVE